MPCDLLQEIHSAYATLNLVSVSIADAQQHTPSHAEVCADYATMPKGFATGEDNAGSTTMLARLRVREPGREYTIFQHGNAPCSGRSSGWNKECRLGGASTIIRIAAIRSLGVFSLAASL